MKDEIAQHVANLNSERQRKLLPRKLQDMFGKSERVPSPVDDRQARAQSPPTRPPPASKRPPIGGAPPPPSGPPKGKRPPTSAPNASKPKGGAPKPKGAPARKRPTSSAVSGPPKVAAHPGRAESPAQTAQFVEAERRTTTVSPMRTMTARQRLEKERKKRTEEKVELDGQKARAKELQRLKEQQQQKKRQLEAEAAAEAKAKAVAEEKAAAAADSIRLGAPGGLHAKAEAAEMQRKAEDAAEAKCKSDAAELERQRQEQTQQKHLDAIRVAADYVGGGIVPAANGAASKPRDDLAEIRKAGEYVHMAINRADEARVPNGSAPSTQATIPSVPSVGLRAVSKKRPPPLQTTISRATSGQPPSVPSLTPDISDTSRSQPSSRAATSSTTGPTPRAETPPPPQAAQTHYGSLQERMANWQNGGNPYTGRAGAGADQFEDISLEDEPAGNWMGGDVSGFFGPVRRKAEALLANVDETQLLTAVLFLVLVLLVAVQGLQSGAQVETAPPPRTSVADLAEEIDRRVHRAGNPHPHGSFENPMSATESGLPMVTLDGAVGGAGQAQPLVDTTYLPPITETAQTSLEQMFSAPITGALEGGNLRETEGVQSALGCASLCTEFGPACLSFDFSAIHKRCYLGSGTIADSDGKTNGATQFLYYERIRIPTSTDPQLHPAAFDLMKDALGELKDAAAKASEQTRNNEATAKAIDESIAQQTRVLHKKMESHSKRLAGEVHSLLDASLDSLEHETASPYIRRVSQDQHCPPGYSGIGCLDFTAVVRSPQHILHFLKDTRAANTTLHIASSLHFKSAVVEFPSERITRFLSQPREDEDGEEMAVPTVSDMQGFEAHGSLTEVCIQDLVIDAGQLGSYIAVGDGATFSFRGCDIMGSFAVRFDGWLQIKECTVLAVLSLTGMTVDDETEYEHQGLSIEDSSFSKTELTLRSPPNSKISFVGAELDRVHFDLLTPTRGGFSIESSSILESQGSLRISGSPLTITDTAISNHSGSLVLCDELFQKGAALIMHGSALVHNHPSNTSSNEVLIDLSECTRLGGRAAKQMPIKIEATTFMNNSISFIDSGAAPMLIDSSSFHANTIGSTGESDVSVGSFAHGLFSFTGDFTLTSSRVTAHSGDVAACHPLGICRVHIEDTVYTDSTSGSLVHMCTGEPSMIDTPQ